VLQIHARGLALDDNGNRGKGVWQWSRLLLEIDVGERLPVGVADDEAGVGFLDGPGGRKARGVRSFSAVVLLEASNADRAVARAEL
jgi:hypothetical protein